MFNKLGYGEEVWGLLQVYFILIFKLVIFLKKALKYVAEIGNDINFLILDSAFSSLEKMAMDIA